MVYPDDDCGGRNDMLVILFLFVNIYHYLLFLSRLLMLNLLSA